MTSDTSAPPFPRGARPDAETDQRIYLIKNVSHLRATYQIRLLALKALGAGKVLVLQVPRACKFDVSLQDLIAGAPRLLVREDL